MIDHVQIANFRCFESLDLKELKRINIIVGRNSSGKSAFMESLFLSSGSNAPQIAFQIRAIRRIGGTLQIRSGDAWLYRGLWDDLFFDYNTHNKVKITVTGNNGDSRSLRITFSEGLNQVIPFDNKKPVSEIESQPRITFTWKRGGGKDIVVKPQFSKDGLELVGSSAEFFPMVWFTPGSGDSADDTARRFSELSKANEAIYVVDALKEEFPFIKDVSIEYYSGVPMLFANVDGKDRKMPIGLISDGVNRLLTILIGIAYFRGGVVMIDELEAGFYYDRLPSIWKLLLRMSAHYQSQLFISTHSAECLDAVRSVLQDNEDAFRLLRAERQQSGCSISSLEGEILESALEQRLEVR